MKFEQPPMPSPEEMAKIEKDRALSDAELLKGGADYKFDEKGQKRLDATDEQIEETREEMNKDLESKTEQAKIDTFRDYFNKSAELFNEVENLKPEKAGKDHPYIKFLNNFGDIRKSIDVALAPEILSGDELVLYQKNQEGPKAFSLTEQDWKEKSSDNWKEWSRSCDINNKLIHTIAAMQETGKIPDTFKEKIANIPDSLKTKLTEGIKQGEELVEELKEKTTQDSKEKIEKKLNPQNVELAMKSGKPVEVKVKRTSGETENDWIVTGVADKDAVVIKSVEGGKFIRKVVPLEELKQWNITTFEKRKKMSSEEINKGITESKNFEDLIKIIEKGGGLQGSQEFYDAKKLKNVIDKVRKGELGITYITRTGGLRQKVEDLLALEKIQKNLENR